MIEGVKITKKNVIVDDRGKILHMLKLTDETYTKFGEIYFSSVKPRIVKAWHYHQLMTLNYAVVKGEVKIVLYDDRSESTTKGKVQEIFISEKNHCLITIPPKIWNGFCSINNDEAIIANCSDIPHEKTEIKRLPYDDPKFPYNWNI